MYKFYRKRVLFNGENNKFVCKMNNLEEESKILAKIIELEGKFYNGKKDKSTAVSESENDKMTPLTKFILRLKNKNLSLFNKKIAKALIEAKSTECKSEIHLLFKEFSLLTNLTRLRIVNFNEFLVKKENRLIGYLYNDESSKIIYIEFLILEDDCSQRLENTRIFWNAMASLFDLV